MAAAVGAEAMFRAVEAASHGSAYSEKRFVLAGRTVSLRATDDCVLRSLSGAFAHLPPAQGTPSLTIHVADGGRCPRPEVEEGLEGAQTVGGHRFWSSPDTRFFCHKLLASGSFYCLDRAVGQITGWVESAGRMATFERAKPVVRPLLLWLEHCGLTPVHAGMVSWRGQGILFGGRGGSGKSTSALCCLQAGFDLLGEDYTLLEPAPDSDRFTGHSLYSSAWIAPDHLQRFAGLDRWAIRGDEMAQGKCILMLNEIYPGSLPASAPVRYLLLPRVREVGRTAIHPASRADALKRFALESMVTLTRLGAAELAVLTRMVRSVSCYWLDLGADSDRVGPEVKGLLDRGGR